MDIQKDLNSLEQEINGLKLRIHNLQLHLVNVEQEISLYKNHKLKLKQNINILKESGILPQMFEYKKIKLEFKSVSSHIVFLQNEFANHLTILKTSQKILADKEKQYDMLLKNQFAKVLKGNFNAKKRNA